MATGIARGAHVRGKLIAFGDGRRILWAPKSKEIFQGNPNIAKPGDERRPNGQLEWNDFYFGHRIYQQTDPRQRKYIWNYEFKAKPGEVFFDAQELKFAGIAGKGFVLIEPNLPYQKPSSVNKQWPVERYQEVVNALLGSGAEVVQLEYHGARHHLSGVRKVSTGSARQALAVLSRAALYIGPEGGMHHGAAALGIPAVVLFGGFIPPAVTGYDMHVNLTGGAEACGMKQRCEHCQKAMQAISVGDVLDATIKAQADRRL